MPFDKLDFDGEVLQQILSRQWLHPLQCLQYMMDLRAGTAQSSVSVKAAMRQWLHSRLVAAIVGTDGTGSRCRAKDHRATQCRTTTFNKICSLVHKKKKEEKTPRWEKTTNWSGSNNNKR